MVLPFPPLRIEIGILDKPIEGNARIIDINPETLGELLTQMHERDQSQLQRSL